ncbi:hypothetical protein [Natronobiforma cellulositropha]|uniref:hypothetical protein n=1 Tax=Natronobiforma cellulositropha TaxID=1679076 RepID=UPI0021D5DA6E|nr:hypothetical protein [Natronobiforma cellulositropha]
MPTAETLERVATVFVCALALALTTGTVLDATTDLPLVAFAALAFVPGTLVGLALVVVPETALTYTHVLRFGLASWLALLVFVGTLTVPSLESTLTLDSEALAFALAFAIGVAAASYDWVAARTQAALG